MSAFLVLALLDAGPPRGPYSLESLEKFLPAISPVLYRADRAREVNVRASSWLNGATLHLTADLETPDQFGTALEWYAKKWGIATHDGRRQLTDGSMVRVIEEVMHFPRPLVRGGVSAYGVQLIHVGKDQVSTVRLASSLTGRGTRIHISVMRTHDGVRPLPMTEADSVAYQFARRPARAAESYAGRMLALEGTVEKAVIDGGIAQVHLAGFKDDKSAVTVVCDMNQDDARFGARFRKLRPGDTVRVQGISGFTPGKDGKPGVLTLAPTRFLD